MKFNCNTLSLVNCDTVSNGEIGFCYCNTCFENEGDCDSDDECQDDLVCGSNNCPASLGFDSAVDCCCSGTCSDPEYKGDNYCDDGNNNCGCEWDGGDCCGSVYTTYCSACECLDPNYSTNSTTITTTTMTTMTTTTTTITTGTTTVLAH